LNRLPGTGLAAEEIGQPRYRVGCASRLVGEGTEVRIASWRHDSASEIAVVEEVARHHGYGRIGRTVPRPPHPGRLDDRQRERRRLRSLLVGRGLSEAMPLPFLAPGDPERCGLPGAGLRHTTPPAAGESGPPT